MSSFSGSHTGYLETTVQSASPARLRLMLIERGIETAARLIISWQDKQLLGSNEHSLRLLDLINELLSGVRGGTTSTEQELCQRIADLYVFLAKHLIAAEQYSDHQAIAEIKLVLETEAETWRAVCALQTKTGPHAELQSCGTGPSPAMGLNLQG
jgi:flagellar protein FliS